eukprot:8441799-Pyramimonas_sp.AAC.1
MGMTVPPRLCHASRAATNGASQTVAKRRVRPVSAYFGDVRSHPFPGHVGRHAANNMFSGARGRDGTTPERAFETSQSRLTHPDLKGPSHDRGLLLTRTP